MSDRTQQLRNGNPIAVANLMPVGAVLPFAGHIEPVGFKFCDGAAFSGSASAGYTDLALAIGGAYGVGSAATPTLSFTNGGSTISSSSAHGLSAGDVIITERTHLITSSLYGLNSLRTAFKVRAILSSTTFTLEDWAGLLVVASDTASGRPFYTSFNVPDLRGRAPFGRDNMGGSYANRLTVTTLDGISGESGGAETHVLSQAEMPAHTHSYDDSTPTLANTRGTGASSTATGSSLTGRTTGSSGSGSAHNNMPPFQVCNYIIRVL